MLMMLSDEFNRSLWSSLLKSMILGHLVLLSLIVAIWPAQDQQVFFYSAFDSTFLATQGIISSLIELISPLLRGIKSLAAAFVGDTIQM